MKAPTLTSPTVGSSGLPGYQQQEARPDTSIARGIGELGQGMQQLGGALNQERIDQQAVVAKAKQEAEALAESNALLEQHRLAQSTLIGNSSAEGRIDDAFSGTDTSQGGFLATKGLAASEASSETLKKLNDDRQTIAATIKDPAARQRFLTRSAESLLAYSKQVETHVAKQFDVARESSMKATEQLSIGMAASGIPDFDLWLTTSRQTEESLRKNAPSPEAGSAAIADFRSRNSAALVSGLLASGKVEEAATTVEEFRGQLGARYPEMKAQVTRANAGAEKDRLIAEGAKLVDGTYESLRQEEGNEYVDPEKLRAAVNVDETDPGVRTEVSAALERRIRQEAERFKTDLTTHRDNANRADVKRQPIPGGTIEWLERNDPDFLLARESRLKAEARAARAARNGNGAGEKEAQKRIDKRFRYRLEARLTEDPNVRPQDVATELIAEIAKEEGEDVTISADELERGGATAAKAVKHAGGDLEKAKKKFVDEFSMSLKAKVKPTGRGAKIDQELHQQRLGNAAVEYGDWVTNNGGKPLDAKAAAELKARLLRDVQTEPGTTIGPFTFGGKTGPAVDLVKPRPTVPTSAQPPVSSVTIRRKSDKKTRVVSAAQAAKFLSDPDFEKVE